MSSGFKDTEIELDVVEDERTYPNNLSGVSAYSSADFFSVSQCVETRRQMETAKHLYGKYLFPTILDFRPFTINATIVRTMSFLALSLEIRHQLYREILCLPEGIEIYLGSSKRDALRKDRTCAQYLETDSSMPDDSGRHLLPRTEVSAFFPISIIFVNHQIYAETLPMLYGTNKFTFNVNPHRITRFLKSLSPSARSVIKDLEFNSNWTWSECYDKGYFWDRLFDHQMHISSVTFPITSHNISAAIDEGKIRDLANTYEYVLVAGCEAIELHAPRRQDRKVVTR